MTERGTLQSRTNRNTPYRCPECAQRPESYFGKLRLHGEEVPVCPNHTFKNKAGEIVSSRVVECVPV